MRHLYFIGLSMVLAGCDGSFDMASSILQVAVDGRPITFTNIKAEIRPVTIDGFGLGPRSLSITGSDPDGWTLTLSTDRTELGMATCRPTTTVINALTIYKTDPGNPSVKIGFSADPSCSGSVNITQIDPPYKYESGHAEGTFNAVLFRYSGSWPNETMSLTNGTFSVNWNWVH